MHFNDRVAIVTGGAKGIGRSITTLLLKKGVTVVVADSDEAAGKGIASELKLLGKIIFVKTDVSVPYDVKQVLNTTLTKCKRLDFLVNNAGVSVIKPLDQLSLEEWNAIVGINLTSVMLFAKYAAPHLRVTHGSIINMAAAHSLSSEPDAEAYAASKGGVVALTQSLAVSLSPEIRVNCISPGWIDSNAAVKKRTGYTRFFDVEGQHKVGKPEDVAAMVAYLVSSESSFVTGQNFTIDGGVTRKMTYA